MKLSDISQDLLNEVISISREDLERESCGLLFNGEIVRCENTSENPEREFVLNEEDSEFAIENDCVVWHSHVLVSAGRFNWSPADVRESVAKELPFLLVHAQSGRLLFFDPTETLPYEGRKWNVYTANCQTLFTDFYRQEFGIEIPRWVPDSPVPWEETGWDEYRQQGQAHGFRMLQRGEAYQYGDVALMRRGRAAAPNHVGILLEPETNHILHHCEDRLSLTEPYGRSLRDSCYAVYRHPEVKHGSRS